MSNKDPYEKDEDAIPDMEGSFKNDKEHIDMGNFLNDNIIIIGLPEEEPTPVTLYFTRIEKDLLTADKRYEFKASLEGRGQKGEAGFYTDPDNCEVLLKVDDVATCLLEGTAYFARSAGLLPKHLKNSVNFASLAVIEDVPNKIASIQPRVIPTSGGTIKPWDLVVYDKKREPRTLWSTESWNKEKIIDSISKLTPDAQWQLAAGIVYSQIVGDESLHLGQFMCEQQQDGSVTGITRIDLGARERFAVRRNSDKDISPFKTSRAYESSGQFGKDYVGYLLANPELKRKVALLWVNMDKKFPNDYLHETVFENSTNALIVQISALPTDEAKIDALTKLLNVINKNSYKPIEFPEKFSDLNSKIKSVAKQVAMLDADRVMLMRETARVEFEASPCPKDMLELKNEWRVNLGNRITLNDIVTLHTEISKSKSKRKHNLIDAYLFLKDYCDMARLQLMNNNASAEELLRFDEEIKAYIPTPEQLGKNYSPEEILTKAKEHWAEKIDSLKQAENEDQYEMAEVLLHSLKPVITRRDPLDQVYGWRIESDKVGKDDSEMNIVFLGTGSIPYFGPHQVMSEGGDVLCQMALQKGVEQGQPTLLLRGIGTVSMPITSDFDESATNAYYPLETLINPNSGFAGGGGGTALGRGLETRLGLAMTSLFIPTLVNRINNQPADAESIPVTINIVGHSRGAITTYYMTNLIHNFMDTIKENDIASFKFDALANECGIQAEQIKKAFQKIKNNQVNFETKILGFDPVEGRYKMAGSWLDRQTNTNTSVQIPGFPGAIPTHCSQLPDSVHDAAIFLAESERRNDFQPTVPYCSGCQPRYQYQIGTHSTMTGNLGDDDGNGQNSYPALKNAPLNSFIQNAALATVDKVKIDANLFLYGDNPPPLQRHMFRRIFTEGVYPDTRAFINSNVPDGDANPSFQEINGLMRNNKKFACEVYWVLQCEIHDAYLNPTLDDNKQKLAEWQLNMRNDTSTIYQSKIKKDSKLALSKQEALTPRKMYIRTKDKIEIRQIDDTATASGSEFKPIKIGAENYAVCDPYHVVLTRFFKINKEDENNYIQLNMAFSKFNAALIQLKQQSTLFQNNVEIREDIKSLHENIITLIENQDLENEAKERMKQFLIQFASNVAVEIFKDPNNPNFDQLNINQKKVSNEFGMDAVAISDIDYIKNAIEDPNTLSNFNDAMQYINKLDNEGRIKEIRKNCESLIQRENLIPILTALLQPNYKTPGNMDTAAFKTQLSEILYSAAINNHATLIRILRGPKVDTAIDNAGPSECPSALCAAAREGNSDAVIALMETYSGTGMGLLGYNNMSRVAQDSEGKTALHHLAEKGSVDAFLSVMYGGGISSTPKKVLVQEDSKGYIPFDYLVDHNRVDIIDAIITKENQDKTVGARIKEKGYIRHSYFPRSLADLHSLADKSSEEKPSNQFCHTLARLSFINPDLYEKVYDHLTSKGHKENAATIQAIKANIEAQNAAVASKIKRKP